MRTQDVEGSRPEIHGYKFNNKESFNLRNDDILGSQSRKLYQGNVKYNYSLETNDIKGSVKRDKEIKGILVNEEIGKYEEIWNFKRELFIF
jgi:hypothetical protein